MYNEEGRTALVTVQGNQASSRVDLGYTELFLIPSVTSVSCRLLAVLLGNLWISIKQIKVPYVFNGEYGIALHATQESRASSRGEGEFSWFFFELLLEPGVYTRVSAGMAIQNLCLFSNVRTPV